MLETKWFVTSAVFSTQMSHLNTKTRDQHFPKRWIAPELLSKYSNWDCTRWFPLKFAFCCCCRRSWPLDGGFINWPRSINLSPDSQIVSTMMKNQVLFTCDCQLGTQSGDNSRRRTRLWATNQHYVWNQWLFKISSLKFITIIIIIYIALFFNKLWQTKWKRWVIMDTR